MTTTPKPMNPSKPLTVDDEEFEKKIFDLVATTGQKFMKTKVLEDWTLHKDIIALIIQRDSERDIEAYQRGYQDGLLAENKIPTKYKRNTIIGRYKILERLTKGGKHGTHNVRLLVECLDCGEMNIRYANRLDIKHAGCTCANDKLATLTSQQSKESV